MLCFSGNLYLRQIIFHGFLYASKNLVSSFFLIWHLHKKAHVFRSQKISGVSTRLLMKPSRNLGPSWIYCSLYQFLLSTRYTWLLIQTHQKVLPQQHTSLNKIFFIWRSSGEQLKLQRSIMLLNALLRWSMIFRMGKIRAVKSEATCWGWNIL